MRKGSWARATALSQEKAASSHRMDRRTTGRWRGAWRTCRGETEVKQQGLGRSDAKSVEMGRVCWAAADTEDKLPAERTGARRGGGCVSRGGPRSTGRPRSMRRRPGQPVGGHGAKELGDHVPFPGRGLDTGRSGHAGAGLARTGSRTVAQGPSSSSERALGHGLSLPGGHPLSSPPGAPPGASHGGRGWAGRLLAHTCSCFSLSSRLVSSMWLISSWCRETPSAGATGRSGAPRPAARSGSAARTRRSRRGGGSGNRRDRGHGDPSPSAHETRNRECGSERRGAETRAPGGRAPAGGRSEPPAG